MYLYHYYDKTIGPFKNLSDISIEQANEVLREIANNKPNVQCAKRQADYMQARFYYENILRNEFTKKGGLISRKVPHYRVNDGKEYRKKLYTYDEILKVINKYVLPQEWNDDGKYGPERYIEAHIWSDDTIRSYM